VFSFATRVDGGRATTGAGAGGGLIGQVPHDQAQLIDASHAHPLPHLDIAILADGAPEGALDEDHALGVEAPAHLTVVRSAGCRMGQGHLFARPQPAEQTEAYLDGFVVRS